MLGSVSISHVSFGGSGGIVLIARVGSSLVFGWVWFDLFVPGWLSFEQRRGLLVRGSVGGVSG